jgi:CO/xanthine dehydrogenase Mo-binding subunit/aerobic-type carbon monoxide dehydrogenase small subunit (CoxS/CutS family)
MIIPVKIRVNRRTVETEVDENLSLLRFLRERLGLMGTKNGCEKGHCGSCTVLVNGAAKRACLLRMKTLSDAEVLTIEGLGGSREKPHFIQRAFIDEGAVQCGFCTPGMIMAAKALLDTNPDPDEASIREALKNNLCRCTGYTAIIRAVQRAARSLSEACPGAGAAAPNPSAGPAQESGAADASGAVGRDVVRKDAPGKVLGEPVYADDLSCPEALTGVLLLSEHAHARVLDIDLGEARSCPGVAAVLTLEDLPGRNGFGLFVPDQTVFAREEVYFRGEVLAAVYAESREQAEHARSRIRVRYEKLPVLADPEVNLKEGSPTVRRDLKNNIAHHVAVRKGDADAGFADAAVFVEGVYRTQAVEHAYLEPESALSRPGEDGSITVWTGSQSSHAYRALIAAALALPEEKVRVVLTACGGGFGGKEEPTVQIHAALGTLKTGRPVRITLTREESLRMSVKRHPMIIRQRHGFSRDGRILAMESLVTADAGAYLSQSMPVVFRSAVTAPGPYEVDAVRADSYGAYTHATPRGAFRGFGSTQACFASEIQMDKAARALGMDPVELRRINGFKAGSQTCTGQTLGDGTAFLPVLDAAAAGLAALRAEYAGFPRPSGVKIGFGIAGAYKNVGIGVGLDDGAGAAVELGENGRIRLLIGAADMGQGSDTAAAQIASEVLGIPYGLIDVTACDTGICPDGGMTTASRQTFVTGNAVKKAAGSFKAMMAPYLPAPGNPAAGTPDAAALASAWKRARDAGILPRAEEHYSPPATRAHEPVVDPRADKEESRRGIHYSYCFAAAAVAVEVDTGTGKIRVLKVRAVQDVGKAIHPANVRGQIEGAALMGVGFALSEEFLEDEDHCITDTLQKLGVTRIADGPIIEAVIVEDPQAAGPFGAKGMGEVGLNPVAPAISNAVFDAAGVRLQELPMKPERVLAALSGLSPGQ